MNISFVDRFNKEDMDKLFTCLNSKLCIVLAVVLLTVVIVTGCANNSNNDDIAVVGTSEEEILQDNENGSSLPVDADGNQIISMSETSMVSVPIEDLGRADPFLPTNEIIKASATQAPTVLSSVDLLPPPEVISVDSTAVEVISTKVSGIMYDKFNPSAILNISGNDYLVRSGDIINNYKVLSISKDCVTVQNGANIYKAGVGELFTGEGINYNTISNLENKFGGSKNAAKKR